MLLSSGGVFIMLLSMFIGYYLWLWAIKKLVFRLTFNFLSPKMSPKVNKLFSICVFSFIISPSFKIIISNLETFAFHSLKILLTYFSIWYSTCRYVLLPIYKRFFYSLLVYFPQLCNQKEKLRHYIHHK